MGEGLSGPGLGITIGTQEVALTVKFAILKPKEGFLPVL